MSPHARAGLCLLVGAVCLLLAIVLLILCLRRASKDADAEYSRRLDAEDRALEATARAREAEAGLAALRAVQRATVDEHFATAVLPTLILAGEPT